MIDQKRFSRYYPREIAVFVAQTQRTDFCTNVLIVGNKITVFCTEQEVTEEVYENF